VEQVDVVEKVKWEEEEDVTGTAEPESLITRSLEIQNAIEQWDMEQVTINHYFQLKRKSGDELSQNTENEYSLKCRLFCLR
jgi:hypothetical protein